MADSEVLEKYREKFDVSSSLWKIISRVIPSKDKEHQVYSKDRHLVAEEFNQYFSSVGRNTAKEALRLADVHDGNVLSNPTPIPIIDVAENQFNLRPVSSATVRAITISMPSSKSPGPEKINMRVIKGQRLSPRYLGTPNQHNKPLAHHL